MQQRNYALYTFGSSVSLLGLWVHRVAIGWLTWELTGSSTWVGLIAFADLIPSVVLTPISGVVVDWFDRRRITLISQAIAMVQALLIGVLVVTGAVNQWWLFGLSLLVGAVWSFNGSARLAMLPNLVEREHMPAAIAVNSAIFNVARFVGPALAGAIIALGGVAHAFFFNAATFVAFIWALCVIRELRHEGRGRVPGSILRQYAEGIRYACRHEGIGPMILLLTILALGVKPVLDLLPVIADGVFGRGATGLAHMTASGGLGALFAAVFLARRATTIGLTAVVLTAVLVGALSVVAMSVFAFYPVALACVFLLGAATTLAGTGTQTLMQSAVDGAVRGRVMSLYLVIFRGGPAVGALALGAAFDWVGVPAALIAGALAAIAGWLWSVRRVRRISGVFEAPAAEELPPGDGQPRESSTGAASR
jgi:MFS family permease